jgi:plastocyanin
MEKPEGARTFITGLVVGGLLFGGGYVTGRSSHDAPGPQPPADERAEDAPSPSPDLATRGRRPPAPRPREAVRGEIGAPGPSPSSAPAPRPGGATLETGAETTVRGLPDGSSPPISTIPRGTVLRVIETRGDYRLVAPAGEGAVLGWILWTAPAGALGKTTIQGVVAFTGRVPEMKVPRKRKDAEFCKLKEVKYDAVLVDQGKLADVLVRLANDAVKGDYRPPARHAKINQVDCMYTPRLQGVVAGQTIDVENADGTLHDVHTYKQGETWFNQPQIKGAPPIEKELPDHPTVVKLTCDVHPWMRGFVVVSAHPFFAVSGLDGAFTIEGAPAGVFTLEAWHPRYGLKTTKIRVEEGKATEVSFRYDGTEPEPPENVDELKDLF